MPYRPQAAQKDRTFKWNGRMPEATDIFSNMGHWGANLKPSSQAQDSSLQARKVSGQEDLKTKSKARCVQSDAEWSNHRLNPAMHEFSGIADASVSWPAAHASTFKPAQQIPIKPLHPRQVSDVVYGAIQSLQHKTLEADFLTSIPGFGCVGRQGFACYFHHAPPFQLRVAFMFPQDWLEKMDAINNKLFRVVGTLNFTKRKMNEFLEKNSGNIENGALQRVGKTPFYFNQDTVRLKAVDIDLNHEQRAIFDYIRSLTGKRVVAELLTFNFRSKVGVSWHSFAVGSKEYGVTIGCKGIQLPDYKNKRSAVFHTSPSRQYNISGEIGLNANRLYRAIKGNTNYYIQKGKDPAGELPVYMLNDSVKVVAS